jgi:GINS complex subunit 3
MLSIGYVILPLSFLSNLYARARLGTSRLVSLDLPPALSERVMNALKADPRTIDLRALAPHFYNLSERILELFEEEEMVDVLSNVCIFFLFFFLFYHKPFFVLI